MQEEDRKKVLAKMEAYRRLRARYEELESSIAEAVQTVKTLYAQQAALGESLDEERRTEAALMLELAASYGHGKLDPGTLQWVHVKKENEEN